MPEEKESRAEDFQCWHWCPIGKHDWCHRIDNTTDPLDEWEKVCVKHEEKAA